MRKLLLEILVILIVAFYLYVNNSTVIPGTGKSFLVAPVPSPSPTQSFAKPTTTTKTLFVPYWALGNKTIDSKDYQALVYFGITADKNGIDQSDTGFQQLKLFLKDTDPEKKRLLGVRMVNSDLNTTILDDPMLQKKIIADAIRIAKENGFTGVVLDFEIRAFGFTSMLQKISNFEIQFAKSTKSNNLQFFATMYGDTMYRLRPFAIGSIAEAADGIMIMAYDLHKANGDPGPNFPLHAASDDYDFSTMIEQFYPYVPVQKTTVIFGLYGYDWQVDEQNRSIGQATALSYNKIKQDFLDTCQFKNCLIKRDNASTETKITYQDKTGNNHVVWFEDMESVAKKTAFLQSRGISSVAYWAYSYF